ncbi:MAG: SDR family oxidoreductase [Clostridia bacterium]|nr:SDR family oxidoreductase [Clostridia bacterium]
MGKVVWITGASSGLGLHTARQLGMHGFDVIAGARSFGQGKAVEHCRSLPLDVTDEKSIDAFTQRALEMAGPPDILVNCAGMLILGACEQYGIGEIEQVMNTNFLGQVRMIQKVLPLMREKDGGKIVNFSSINGLLGIPFEGAYTASKHAIEGFSECLALEVKPYGIEVMLVEPGDHQSGSAAYRRHSGGITEASPYKAAFDIGTGVIAHDEANGSDPDRLGEKMAKVLKRRHLPKRLRVAKGDQRLAVVLHDVLPAWAFDRIIGSYYKKPKK